MVNMYSPFAHQYAGLFTPGPVPVHSSPVDYCMVHYVVIRAGLVMPSAVMIGSKHNAANTDTPRTDQTRLPSIFQLLHSPAWTARPGRLALCFAPCGTTKQLRSR
jgi:hypothetical protein